MQLFEILGDNFFKPLTSKYHDIFADCLIIIYETYNNELSYGVDKEYIIDKLVTYFENKQSNNIVFEDDTESIAITPREKAQAIIRKLKDCNWIELEQSLEYKTLITLLSHSVTIIQSLRSITKNNELEYEASVSTIYSILNNKKSYDKPYQYAIKEVYYKTKELISELKKLNSNIKNYIDSITMDKDTKDIIEMFFEYQNNIFSKPFRRIHTSENISIFRKSIIEKLKYILNDENILNLSTNGYMKVEECSNFEVAKETIINMINNIIYAFEYTYDDIVKDINYRNSKYIESAIARAKFLLSNNNDIEGKINQILRSMVEDINVNNQSLNDYISSDLEPLFEIIPQGFIDNQSLAVIPIDRKTGIPEEIYVDNSISQTERNQLKEKLKHQQENKFSKKNINRYVINILKDRPYILASQLELCVKRDVIRIIYIKLYANTDKVDYTITNVNNKIVKSSFEFMDFKIERIHKI